MKRLFALFLSLCLILSLPMAVRAEEEATDPTEIVRAPGQCGEDLYWDLVGGTLTISGSGAMDDFPENAPWHSHKDEITKVQLENVTYVGANAFRDYDHLTEVDFGSKLYEIGANAFRSCDGLTKISLPTSFKVFGESSFQSCASLKEIHCAGRFPSFRQNSMWDTRATIYFPADKPWNPDTIRQLEEAFQGRIEFLASDGSDPVTDDETPPETEPETQPETEPEPTVPETQPETTEPVTEATNPGQTPTDSTQPETQKPADNRDEPESDDEEEPETPGLLIPILLIAAVAVAIVLGMLLLKPKGKYSRR